MRWWRIHNRDADLDRELHSDLELEEEEQRERGLSGDEARYAAHRAFGNATLIKEHTREAWGVVPFETFLQDLRYGVRQLWRSPGFAITAVLTLAIGIGANLAIFGIIDSVLLRPLAYPEPDRIVQLEKVTPAASSYSASIPLFLVWSGHYDVLQSIAAYSVLPTSFNLAQRDHAERVPGLRVSADFFRVLGVQPRLGRNFSPDDDRPGAQDVVLLTNSLWHRRYNGNPAIVGKTIEVDGQPSTVIGILPPGFQFLAVQSTMGAIELWTPLHMPSASRDPSGTLQCIARLKHGVTLEQAVTRMTALSRQLAAQLPSAFPSNGAVALLPLQQR